MFVLNPREYESHYIIPLNNPYISPSRRGAPRRFTTEVLPGLVGQWRSLAASGGACERCPGQKLRRRDLAQILQACFLKGMKWTITASRNLPAFSNVPSLSKSPILPVVWNSKPKIRWFTQHRGIRLALLLYGCTGDKAYITNNMISTYLEMGLTVHLSPSCRGS